MSYAGVPSPLSLFFAGLYTLTIYSVLHRLGQEVGWILERLKGLRQRQQETLVVRCTNSFPFSWLIDAMCRLDQLRSFLFLLSCRMGASCSSMCSMSCCRVDLDLAYHRDVSSLLRLFSFHRFYYASFQCELAFRDEWPHIYTMLGDIVQLDEYVNKALVCRHYAC